ncbi:hypothetical protein ACFWPK_28305 [Nocardia sp. NPDC058519]|uniref:hypothetical protein n=1 Tax=Nocardia sp. NPDC058519 TaxID=3346535 RepID=UPI00364E195B
MSDRVKDRVDALNKRAALRSMTVRRVHEPPYGWMLANPFRVVCSGSLENIEAWLTAAELQDKKPVILNPVATQADY